MQPMARNALPGLEIVLVCLLVMGVASTARAMGPFARGNTFPGTLRCVLRANMAAHGVVGASGAPNSQGTLDIYVYSFRNHINVRVILFSYGLDSNSKPLNQTINFGPKGLNGGWLWNITGTWVPQSDNQMQLDSWRDLPGLLLLLSLFAATASAFNGVGPVERIAPPPGILRCSLRVDLKDNAVISSSLGGDLGGNGDLNIYVYKYQGGIDVHISYNTHELSLPMPPLNQSINLGRRGANGAVVWNIEGTWTQRNEDQLELKRVFKRAPQVMIPGTGMSVYKMVKAIEKNPGKYYATIATDMYPEGAIRGQFFRGFPTQLIRRPAC
ncbi:unnamed protein product [Closterium sp. Yama58-4]|nr:unnamed protein product [Closterium sp. Yama58-4]